MQNRCAEIEIRAERNAGEMLAETTVKGGERHKSHNGTYERKPIISELDVTKNDSYRWQSIASIPVDLFEEHVEPRAMIRHFSREAPMNRLTPALVLAFIFLAVSPCFPWPGRGVGIQSSLTDTDDRVKPLGSNDLPVPCHHEVYP